MRISDWSSDVCSSDLHREIADRSDIGPTRGELGQALESRVRVIDRAEVVEAVSRHRGQRCEIQVQVDAARVELDLAAIGAGADQIGLVVPGQRPQAAVSIDLRSAVAIDLLQQRSEEHTSELQSLMRISYAVFCLN